MRRDRSWLLAAIVFMGLVGLVGYKGGSNAAVVVPIVGTQSGTAISSSAPIAVTNATKYSDPFVINIAEAHSLTYTFDCATVVSVSPEIQVSTDYNKRSPSSATWDSVQPTALTWTFTGDEAGVRVLSLPVCTAIRLKFPADGSSRAYDVDRLAVSHW